MTDDLIRSMQGKFIVYPGKFEKILRSSSLSLFWNNFG